MSAFRPKVKGLRNVPGKGPVIIASNHLSFSDSIFMPLVVPRKVTFLATIADFINVLEGELPDAGPECTTCSYLIARNALDRV